MAAQRGEGFVHADAVALGEHAFRLFDEHTAVERLLELLGQQRAAMGQPLLKDADGRDVGKRLRQLLIRVGDRRGA